MRKQRRLTLVALLAAGSLLAAACGDDDDSDAGSGAAETLAPTETEAPAGGTDTTAAEEGGADTTTAEEGGGENTENADEGVYADRVDIGVIVDQTGPTASTQTVFEAGITAAVEAKNAEGGVSGREINLLIEDEQYAVDVGLAAMDKLWNQTPTLAIVGTNNSSFQAAADPVIREDEVIIVGPQSTTQVAVNPFNPTFFSMQCTYADQADVAVAAAIRLLGKEDISATAFVGDVASGEEWGNLIKERVEKAGGTYKGTVKVAFGAPDADAQAQGIASDPPDVLFYHGGTSLLVPMVSSLQKFGVTDVPGFGIFATMTVPVYEAAPDVTDQMYSVNCFNPANQVPDPPEAAPDLVAAGEAAGYEPEIINAVEFANGYVVGSTLIAALEIAGADLSRESYLTALEQVDLNTGGLSPNVKFSPDNHIGIQAVQPFSFDTAAAAFSPIGTYEEWGACFANQYVTDNIDAWSPDCAPDVEGLG